MTDQEASSGQSADALNQNATMTDPPRDVGDKPENHLYMRWSVDEVRANDNCFRIYVPPEEVPKGAI